MKAETIANMAKEVAMVDCTSAIIDKKWNTENRKEEGSVGYLLVTTLSFFVLLGLGVVHLMRDFQTLAIILAEVCVLAISFIFAVLIRNAALEKIDAKLAHCNERIEAHRAARPEMVAKIQSIVDSLNDEDTPVTMNNLEVDNDDDDGPYMDSPFAEGGISFEQEDSSYYERLRAKWVAKIEGEDDPVKKAIRDLDEIITKLS